MLEGSWKYLVDLKNAVQARVQHHVGLDSRESPSMNGRRRRTSFWKGEVNPQNVWKTGYCCSWKLSTRYMCNSSSELSPYLVFHCWTPCLLLWGATTWIQHKCLRHPRKDRIFGSWKRPLLRPSRNVCCVWLPTFRNRLRVNPLGKFLGHISGLPILFRSMKQVKHLALRLPNDLDRPPCSTTPIRRYSDR